MAQSASASARSPDETKESTEKRRALESAIETRVRRLQLEQEALLQLGKQVAGMEAQSEYSIEQLRQEIVSVNQQLEAQTTRLSHAEEGLAAATAELQERQETKRFLSEQLMSVLLESEESAAGRLQKVEAELSSFEGASPETAARSPG